MAFIPDDAEDRFNELSPSAERFYIYLCKTRNHKKRVSYGTLDACAEKYGWKRATRFAVQKELIEAGWIQKENNNWRILVGDFSPVDKSKNLDSQESEQSKNLDFQSKKIDSESKKSDLKSKKSDSHIRNIPALPETIPETIPEEKKDTPSVSAAAQQIFEHWVSVCVKNKSNAVFNKKRRSAVEAVLRESYTFDDIKEAINGCNITPHNCGQNASGGIYKDLELICRNGSNVERFRENWQNKDAIKTTNGATNGASIQKHQPTAADRRSQSAIDEYQRTELIRANVVRRREELRGRDVSGGR